MDGCGMCVVLPPPANTHTHTHTHHHHHHHHHSPMPKNALCSVQRARLFTCVQPDEDRRALGVGGGRGRVPRPRAGRLGVPGHQAPDRRKGVFNSGLILNALFSAPGHRVPPISTLKTACALFEHGLREGADRGLQSPFFLGRKTGNSGPQVVLALLRKSKGDGSGVANVPVKITVTLSVRPAWCRATPWANILPHTPPWYTFLRYVPPSGQSRSRCVHNGTVPPCAPLHHPAMPLRRPAHRHHTVRNCYSTYRPSAVQCHSRSRSVAPHLHPRQRPLAGQPPLCACARTLRTALRNMRGPLPRLLTRISGHGGAGPHLLLHPVPRPTLIWCRGSSGSGSTPSTWFRRTVAGAGQRVGAVTARCDCVL